VKVKNDGPDNRGVLEFYIFLFLFFKQGLRDRVVAAASPGIAGEDSFQGEPCAFKRAVFPEGLYGIFGTGRRVAAAGGF